MGSLFDALNSYEKDISETSQFCNDVYDSLFRSSFELVYQLQARMQSDSNPITDSELTEILTTLPLKLFEVSENLNAIKLEQQTIKLRMKEHRHKRIVELSEGEVLLGNVRLSATDKRDWILKCVAAEMTDHEVLISAYDTIIDRIEHEISMSRELIMGAKKIWDGRRATETVNPISEVVPSTELPDYQEISKSTNVYIK